MKHFNVALLGFGTVGSGVYRIINENGAQIAHREGIELSVSRILVRDFEHEPNLDMAPRALISCGSILPPTPLSLPAMLDGPRFFLISATFPTGESKRNPHT